MTMKKKEAQILLDRRLFQAFAGVAPDAVIMLDTKGKILFWNPAAQRIFGYSSDEAIGMDMHRSLAPQRYQEVIKKGFSVFGKTGQGMAVGKTLELAAMHKDGHEFPIELSVAATQLNDEWHAVGIIRDITKRKRAEEALRISQEQLRQFSIHDPLTGLYNRRELETSLFKEIQRSDRSSHPLSLLMLDIDFFKHVNDTYGHQAGDEVLQHLAKIVTATIRAGDTATRFGGEEFVVILPETGTTDAQKLAERIRKDIADSVVTTSSGNSITYKVSIGIATYPKHGTDQASLLAAADKALYRAKESGRDRVCVA